MSSVLKLWQVRISDLIEKTSTYENFLQLSSVHQAPPKLNSGRNLKAAKDPYDFEWTGRDEAFNVSG